MAGWRGADGGGSGDGLGHVHRPLPPEHLPGHGAGAGHLLRQSHQRGDVRLGEVRHFLILPEEDPAKNFIAGLMIQNLSRELFSVADEHDGRLKNRVVLFCDELGTMPPFDILPLFSAGRSRGLTLVPIIQSLAQLEKNYGKEGAKLYVTTARTPSSVAFRPRAKPPKHSPPPLAAARCSPAPSSQGKESSQSLQMMERPLMTPDELKSIPKGEFVVMKTGTHPCGRDCACFWIGASPSIPMGTDAGAGGQKNLLCEPRRAGPQYSEPPRKQPLQHGG